MTAPHDHLANLGARVATAGSTGASTSRQILDSGRHGLEFFRAFGPAHAALTGGDFDFERDFAHRYDGDGEFGFAALRADRERLAGIGEGLDDVAIGLRNRGDAVFGSWAGRAAEAARSRFGDLLSTAGELRGRFARLSEVVAEVVEVADRACYAKAEGVGRLHATEVDGRGGADVAFLVEVVPRLRAGQADDDELTETARVCGVTVPPMRRTADGQARLASAVDAWLTGTFAPEYEWRAHRFDDLCATADRELAKAWDTLSRALDEVRADQTGGAAASNTVAASSVAVPPADRADEGADEGADDDTRPEPLAPGQATGAMAPQGFSGPSPAIPAASVAGPAAAPAGGAGFFGGIPFFGGVGATGGGDTERPSLNLPTAAGAFDDLAVPDRPVAIGADDDAAHYNEEAAEKPAAKPEPKKDPFDDLW
jgi:hypothetical protein